MKITKHKVIHLKLKALSICLVTLAIVLGLCLFFESIKVTSPLVAQIDSAITQTTKITNISTDRTSGTTYVSSSTYATYTSYVTSTDRLATTTFTESSTKVTESSTKLETLTNVIKDPQIQATDVSTTSDQPVTSFTESPPRQVAPTPFTPYVSDSAPTSSVQTIKTKPNVTMTVASQPGTSTSQTTSIIERVARVSAEIANSDTRDVELAGSTDQKALADLFKDSNIDGISDFDSIYLYSIDPIKSSKLGEYEGRLINAGEKVLLGFDPSALELIKINPQEPEAANAPILGEYKVTHVALTAENKVTFKGVALPNSFVTLFIYSTPIVVTVKSNDKGEWQYTLDQELASGKHVVYVASVNNTGKILAKSEGYKFTKTAEAAILEIAPSGIVENEKPGLTSTHMFILIGALVMVSVLILFVIGRNPKEV